MRIADELRCGNEPRSAASVSELARTVSRKFEQELGQMVASIGEEDLSPANFRGLLAGLRGLLAMVGRDTIEQFLRSQDPARSAVELDGERLRYRGVSAAEWLTPFGRITVPRRTYRADGAGQRMLVPLDDACGMSGRFMTADIEEMAVLGMAMLTGPEVEQILTKALPEAPSATAIQNAAHKRGGEVAAHHAAIESAIDEQAPLATNGDLLVVSFDGVMAPMREGTEVAWREAGVGTISIYGQGKEGPEKRDTRFLARMPETGMKTLLDRIAEQVARATSSRTFREVVLICDGKDTIWSAAGSKPELQDATWILDFYHASENLKKAATAIFGQGAAADRWHKRQRDKLILHDQAVDNLLRTRRRCLRLRDIRSDARDIVDNAITYFSKHRERMRYATFIANGLPIGSGPVEAAAKNIVQARLKRSGMRWSRDGGQHVLDLRCYLKSNRWQPMWDTLTKAA